MEKWTKDTGKGIKLFTNDTYILGGNFYQIYGYIKEPNTITYVGDVHVGKSLNNKKLYNTHLKNSMAGVLKIDDLVDFVKYIEKEKYHPIKPSKDCCDTIEGMIELANELPEYSIESTMYFIQHFYNRGLVPEANYAKYCQNIVKVAHNRINNQFASPD